MPEIRNFPDARRTGFETVLVEEGTRPVTPTGNRDALEPMRQARLTMT
ncbi:hypothetical protein [Guyparkeria sp.]